MSELENSIRSVSRGSVALRLTNCHIKKNINLFNGLKNMTMKNKK